MDYTIWMITVNVWNATILKTVVDVTELLALHAKMAIFPLKLKQLASPVGKKLMGA